MKIAQVSPLMEAVPPKLYGGTERIVSYLTEELVALGHEVTLFASGDSRTSAKLVPGWPTALRLAGEMRDYLAPHLVMLEQLAQRAHEFDVIHFHVDYLSYSVFQRLDLPFVTTLHGRLDLPELKPLYRVFNTVPVISISDSQREPLPEANYIATIHHGIPTDCLGLGTGSGGYLAFIGRISPEKAPDAAIRIAALAGMNLKIAAKIDRADQDYFDSVVRPLLDQPHVEFIGEINEAQKRDFLGEAAALLFPIAWREPFGLAMIEAMACGTPVIAMRNGSVPEIIDPGVTGYIIDTDNTRQNGAIAEADAARAARASLRLDRARIRQVFEQRFSARRMAQDYLAQYRALVTARTQPLRAAE